MITKYVVKHLYSGRYLNEKGLWTDFVKDAAYFDTLGEAEKACDGHPGAYPRRVA